MHIYAVQNNEGMFLSGHPNKSKGVRVWTNSLSKAKFYPTQDIALSNLMIIARSHPYSDPSGPELGDLEIVEVDVSLTGQTFPVVKFAE